MGGHPHRRSLPARDVQRSGRLTAGEIGTSPEGCGCCKMRHRCGEPSNAVVTARRASSARTTSRARPSVMPRWHLRSAQRGRCSYGASWTSGARGRRSAAGPPRSRCGWSRALPPSRGAASSPGSATGAPACDGSRWSCRASGTARTRRPAAAAFSLRFPGRYASSSGPAAPIGPVHLPR